MKNPHSGVATIQDISKMEEKALPEFPNSTYEFLKNGAEIEPSNLALRFFLQGTEYQKSVDFTFEEFMETINQTANLFRGLGIGDKDVVTLIVPNLPETLFSTFGGETAGIVNPINPLLEPDQMAEIMNAAGTKVLVTLSPFPKVDIWDKVASILDKVPTLETVLTLNIGRYLTGIKKLVVSVIAKKPKSDANVRILNFNKEKDKYPKDKLNFERKIKQTDIASYFHTGGTTGTPKLAQHQHINEIFDAWTANNLIKSKSKRTFFCGLPWFHVNAVTVTGLIPLSNGETIVLATPSGYRGEGVMTNFWKIVEHYKVSFFSGVPTVYQVLLNLPIENEDISSLQYGLCGAAPMPVGIFKEFEKKTGVKILEGYGLTEGNCISSVNPPGGERRVGSIGFRLPYQDMKVVLLDNEGKYLKDARVDEIGVIAIRGLNVFPGYKESIHNKEVWIDRKGKRWLNTGDLGRQDADGYFWLTGRKKELIIRGGHNIDPNIIEEPMHQHPAIDLVAAVGRPDQRVGELPVLYVQLKPGRQASQEELLEFAKKNIGERAAIPKKIYILEEMPLTAIGKIFKPDLVKMQIKDIVEGELAQVDYIAGSEVEIITDKAKGMIAIVKVKADEGAEPSVVKEAVEGRLGMYAVLFEVEIS